MSNADQCVVFDCHVYYGYSPPQRAAPETSEQPVDVEMGSENDSADEIDTDDGDNAMYVLSFRYECACSC